MTDELDETPRPAPRSRGPAIYVAVGLLVALVALCAGGWVLARGMLARRAARAALEARGMVCDDDFDFALTNGGAQAEVAPCACTMEEGPIAQITLLAPVTLDLEGETVTRVRAEHVRVSLRGDGPAVDAGSLGPIASMLGVPARIGGMVQAASTLAHEATPPIAVETLDVEQSGRTVVTLTGLALDGARPLGIAAERAQLPGLSGPLGASADVTLDHLTGTATASDVTLEAELALHGTAPIVGTVTRSGHLTVTGSGLDGDAPSYRIEL